MSFVIAIIGCFVYALLYTTDRYKQEKVTYTTERSIIANGIVFDKWCSEVVDVELENKVTHTPLLWNLDSTYEDKITSVIHSYPTLNEVFGGEYGYLRFFKTHPTWCARILMASEGKLLKNDAYYGIRSPDVFSTEKRKEWVMNHEIMTWIDKQLRLHGVKHEMFFVNGSNLDTCKYNKDQLIPFKEADGSVGGRYCWLFMINNMSIY